MRDLRAEIAVKQKRIILLEQENAFLKGELRGVGHRKVDPDTTDRINMALEKRLATWYFYRDRFLIPSLQIIHHALVMAVLTGLAYAFLESQKP